MHALRLLLVCALLTTSSAAAQAPVSGRSGVASGGITVLGRGTAAATPDRARISIAVFGNASPQSTNAAPLDDAANALRSALQSDGVGDSRVVLPIGNLNTRSVAPAIIGTLEKPTRERLEAIARAVVKALPDRFAPALANAQIQVTLLVDDCARMKRAPSARPSPMREIERGGSLPPPVFV